MNKENQAKEIIRNLDTAFDGKKDSNQPASILVIFDVWRSFINLSEKEQYQAVY